MNGCSKLERWGEWCRNRDVGSSLPRETTIYRAMAGKVRLNIPWRPEGLGSDDSISDIDRRVAALPANLRRALIAEYVVGGDVRGKTAAAGLPTSTYYRTLIRARRMLFESSPPAG